MVTRSWSRLLATRSRICALVVSRLITSRPSGPSAGALPESCAATSCSEAPRPPTDDITSSMPVDGWPGITAPSAEHRGIARAGHQLDVLVAEQAEVLDLGEGALGEGDVVLEDDGHHRLPATQVDAVDAADADAGDAHRGLVVETGDARELAPPPAGRAARRGELARRAG